MMHGINFGISFTFSNFSKEGKPSTSTISNLFSTLPESHKI